MPSSKHMDPLLLYFQNMRAATKNVIFHGDILMQGNVRAGVTAKTTGNITEKGKLLCR